MRNPFKRKTGGNLEKLQTMVRIIPSSGNLQKEYEFLKSKKAKSQKEMLNLKKKEFRSKVVNLQEGLKVLKRTTEKRLAEKERIKEGTAEIQRSEASEYLKNLEKLDSQVSALLKSIRKKDYETASKILSDSETMRLIRDHSSVPLKSERNKWETQVKKQFGKEAELTGEMDLAKGYLGMSAGPFGTRKPRVSAVGALRQFRNKAGEKITVYSSPGQILEHEKAHGKFNEMLIKKGIDEVWVKDKHSERKVNPDNFRKEIEQAEKERKAVFIKTNLSGAEAEILEQLSEAYVYLKTENPARFAFLKIEKRKGTGKYGDERPQNVEGRFLAGKMAERKVNPEVIIRGIMKGKKPSEIKKELLS